MMYTHYDDILVNVYYKTKLPVGIGPLSSADWLSC